MISPNNASVDYGTMLKAPAGYAVDFAIGTTYSLDLHALMGAYLSLGLAVDTDSSLATDDLYLFAALSELKDKVMVFCEKGRIIGRGDYSALYCQLESGIVEVDLPEAVTETGRFAYPSFHPKTWIIRFTPTEWTGPARYRVCVLSRNLTFDGSWDLAGSFEGDYREQHSFASPGSYSIRAYLDALRRLYGKGAYSSKFDTIIDEIPYVNFTSGSRDYQLALPFSFTGIPGAKSFDQEFSDALAKSSRVLVITPFLSAASGGTDPLARIAHHFDDEKPKPLLVTRRDSIAANPGIARKLNAFSTFVVRDDLVTTEFEKDEVGSTENGGRDSGNNDEGSSMPLERDIHAKAYLFERARQTDCCDLFFGSANASVKGLFANCEAMSHLTVKHANAFDRMLAELGLTPDELDRGSLFEPLSPERMATMAPLSDEEQGKLRKQQAFDHFLRKIALSMRIKQGDEANVFKVIVAASGDAEQMRACRISLATGGISLPLDAKTTFEGIGLEKLTELVKVKCVDGDFKSTRLMKCRLLEGADYLELQRRELFKHVTKRRFAEYLEFRLSGNPELVASMASERRNSNLGSQIRAASSYSGLYENLLRAYVTKPEQADAFVSECLNMLSTGQSNLISEAGDEEIESIRHLLEVVQKGARYAR